MNYSNLENKEIEPADENEINTYKIKGIVKWFDEFKGYGFVNSDDGDILLHSSCLKRIGKIRASEGATVECEVVRGVKGLQALKVISLDESTSAPVARIETSEIDIPSHTSEFVSSTVKWFNRARGFGFLTSNIDSDDIFVHMETLRNYGIGELIPGQRLRVRYTDGAKGKMAVQVEFEADN